VFATLDAHDLDGGDPWRTNPSASAESWFSVERVGGRATRAFDAGELQRLGLSRPGVRAVRRRPAGETPHGLLDGPVRPRSADTIVVYLSYLSIEDNVYWPLQGLTYQVQKCFWSGGCTTIASGLTDAMGSIGAP
jgi:hypothetical protein